MSIIRYVNIEGIRKQAQADDFEQKLAQMADAEISQNIPSLTPHKIGFQIIDKNDDDTRGVGVMVYRIKEQWIYIPVFFLNGRLRGYDMMYLPDRQQFIPSKDNWLSYISSKQPISLGETAEDTGAKPKKPEAVNLRNNDYDHIILKNASILKDLGLGGLCTFKGYEEDLFNLKKWLPRLGKEAAVSFMKTINDDTEFANAILKYYTPEDIEGMVKEAGQTDEAPNEEYPLMVNPGVDSQEELVLVTKDTPDEKADLDDAAKEVLMRDGVFVIDERKDTSTVFQPKDVPGNLSTPKTSGYYDILMADGSFKQFYVAVVKKGEIGGSRSNNELAKTTCYLIPAEGGKGRAAKVDEFLLGRQAAGKNNEDIGSIGMTAQSFTRTARDDHGSYLLLDKCGNSFVVQANPDSIKLMGNRMVGAHQWSTAGGIEKIVIEFTGKDGELYKNSNIVYVPDNVRAIRTGYDDDKYVFGNLNTIRFKIQKDAVMKPLKIYTDGVSWSIDGLFGTEPGLNKIAALTSLVKRHRIHAPTAKMMLNKKGSLGQPVADRYMIKYAASLADLIPPETQPDFDRAPYEITLENMDPRISSDATAEVVKASDAGVKDVMDVSVLRALAMSSSSSRLINDYISDLLLGLDRIGRILFMFYWHNDDFKERYGNDKLMELEDALRNEFQGLSDLILFLHKSTVEPSADLFGEELSENIG